MTNPIITKLAISGYRSLRDVRLPLGPLNVVTGANGSGKSSLYRALRLLADIAQGRIIADDTPEAFKKSSNPVVAQFISGDTHGPLLEGLPEDLA